MFPEMTHPWRLKVGLALGGGAARGLAHVGVLRALLREGIPLDVITGTSMGAIVGGAYAAGGDIAGVEHALRTLLASESFQKTRVAFLRETKSQRGGLLYSVSRFVRQGIVYGMSTMRSSFLSAEQFAANMRAIVPDARIEDLSVRFAAVAVDLEAGREVVLSRGSLRDAVAASAAIPGILPPRRVNGRLLIDGGWVDKVPVLPAFRLGADVVIAVDISAELDDPKAYRRGIDVFLRANSIKDAMLVGLLRRMADVVVQPAVRRVHWADFEKFDFCIAAGDRAVVEALPAIRDLLQHERWKSMVRPHFGRRVADHFLDDDDSRLTVE